MASRLASAHIEAERRLRALAVGTVERTWRNLGGWNRVDVPGFLELVVPVVLTAQRQSVALTDAYLARALERQPIGVAAGEVIGSAARAGADPREVYERPFVTMWTSLGDGKQFSDAFNAGLARAKSTAAMDVQLAMRGTANLVQEADEAIFGYTRVADPGACEFCQEVDGAYVKSADAFPLHNFCGCGLEPNTEPHRLAAASPPAVAIHEHGELGPMLGSPDHDFTQL